MIAYQVRQSFRPGEITPELSAKGGGIPQKERESLSDEQVDKLLDAIRGLPHTFL